MTPNVLCLKALDASGNELWSFCWIEGQSTGSMLQEVKGWVNNTYPFSQVCVLLYCTAVMHPHDKLTFSVVVPSTSPATPTPPLAAD